MRIAAVTVRNYRCLKDVTIQLDSYGVFIGANGSGKSSVLYGLDWFFNETPLSVTDIHGYIEANPDASSPTIEVSVTFVDLTDKDRERLKEYGRGDRTVIRRTWYADTGKTKTVGNSKQGPGFSEVREDQQIAPRRQKYQALRSTYPDLQHLTGGFSKDAILDALAAWEADPAHADLLVEVGDADAEHMFGWHGSNVLRECVRFVLIPAATSIAGEVGSASKGTALTELVGAFMSAASARAQTEWLQKHEAAVNELSGEIRKSIEGATGVQASRINSRLASLVPNASVTLTPSVPEFNPTINPSIATAVTIDGMTNDVARQGHGVQRAVMISMFQAIVPDQDLTRSTHTTEEGEDEEAAKLRLDESLSGLPGIVVAIEEPEIYQHPIRARSFARTLTELSEEPHVQVLLATHSPYFVQPDRFAALHRFTYSAGEAVVTNATVAAVASASGIDEDKVKKAIASHVPTEFSEGFFADKVVLVEGQTDRIVLEAISRKVGTDLDSRGVTILSVGSKTALPVTNAILSALKIPTYVIADGDFGTSARKLYGNNKTEDEIATSRNNAHQSHQSATEKIVNGLSATSAVIEGALPYSFGDSSVVTEDFIVWRDDIEEELAAWPSFEAALSTDGVDLSARNNKDSLAYRNAVDAADEFDIPAVLRSAVGALAATSLASAAIESSSTGEKSRDSGKEV